ncbi:DUF6460 domain-containing protein [Ahrensia sp. R2A130]|uniref:DUF6460 domain-containing protein n=1 Tax=Ahrensia sp. R2A130 TaxID=744979 RepID=UPI0001E0CA20|nr:DUF6460 domain-containing protein [Ahrensia sp. R2A130]EFL87858.1 conserved hypothetical protein [Ahrensia sp. R2A130]
MSGSVTRFLGGSPAAVAVKLFIASLIVGVIMSTLGWTPMVIWDGVIRFFANIWELGFDALASSAEYLLLGAAVVIPAFFIIRLFSFRSRD